MMSFAKLGAVCFGLWGLLHVAGGGYILSAVLLSGPGGGYMIYGHDGSALPRIRTARSCPFFLSSGNSGDCRGRRVRGAWLRAGGEKRQAEGERNCMF